jgi:hypothetical protein
VLTYKLNRDWSLKGEYCFDKPSPNVEGAAYNASSS